MNTISTSTAKVDASKLASSASSSQTLADWLQAEPFTLALSSGFFGFFAHTGCLLALREAGLMPQRYTGASAGALTSAFAASGMEDKDIVERLFALKREEFWDPKIGLGLLRGDKMQGMLREILPVERIEDSPTPLAISVFDVVTRKTVVLEEGDLAAAINASCAVPGMFHPVKVNGRYYLDGGILDKDGIAGIQSNERTLFNHLMSRTIVRRYLMNTEKLPLRSNLKALAIENLPKVSPFKMNIGEDALHIAQNATRKALSLPSNRAVYRLKGSETGQRYFAGAA